MPQPESKPVRSLRVRARVERYTSSSAIGLYSAGDVARIRLTEVEPCCGELREAWDAGAVLFGERGDGWSKDPNVNIAAVAVYPEGAVSTEFPIRYCPFCAALVAVTLTEATPDA